MAIWSNSPNDILGRLGSLSALATSFHASLYHVSESEAALVLRQPDESCMPSPYITRELCIAWFPTQEPHSLAERLRAQLGGVTQVYIAHMRADSTMVPIRIASGPVRLSPVGRRRVTSDVAISPPFSHDEWLLCGNTSRFQVLVNYDLYSINTSADIDILLNRLAAVSSFFLSVKRYQGDVWDMLCDNHGCSISYVDFASKTKLFSMSRRGPGAEPYVERFVEELNEGTEEESRFIIPKSDALSMLELYLRSEAVSGLHRDHEYDV